MRPLRVRQAVEGFLEGDDRNPEPRLLQEISLDPVDLRGVDGPASVDDRVREIERKSLEERLVLRPAERLGVVVRVDDLLVDLGVEAEHPADVDLQNPRDGAYIQQILVREKDKGQSLVPEPPDSTTGSILL